MQEMPDWRHARDDEDDETETSQVHCGGIAVVVRAAVVVVTGE